jgi:hypothetical protein
MKPHEQPPPGSDAALALGCTCQRWARLFPGMDVGRDLVVAVRDCPLHDPGERHEVREDDGEP